MRIRRFPPPLLLFLIPAISSTIAVSLPNTAVSTESTAPGQGLPHSALLGADAAAADAARSKSRGVPEAPIDGKDGKPHEGPFLETSADRDRKKAKEFPGKGRPLNPEMKDAAQHVAPDGSIIPSHHDGVMDDKDRPGPKEGTRGTEGGISEKNKEDRYGVEKKPDPPKEAPPLPHSEQQKIHGAEDGVPKKKEGDKVLEVG